MSDALVEQRILEQYARAGDRAVVTGWASLRLQGGGFFDGLARDGRTPLAVPIAANGERLAEHPGIHRVRDTVPPDEVVVVHGIRCTRVERALFDEMRRLPDERERAVAVSMCCAAQLTSIVRMRRYCACRRWFRDVRTTTAALNLAVEDARSPQEFRFGLIWEHDARWGPPLYNRTLLDLDGNFLGIPDLLDDRRGVVGEYAGADHRDAEMHENDIEREALFRAAGLEYVEVVGRDLRRRDRVMKRMTQAEERAGRFPRRWVVGPRTLPSLDEILDKRDAQRPPHPVE